MSWKPTVLLVDDEREIGQLFKDISEKENFDVIVRYDVDSSIDIIKNEKCDIVISDIQMPGKSGLELLKISKSVNPQIPVIMITGQGNENTAIKSLKCDAYDYFRKPFRKHEIIPSMNRAFEKRKVDLENQRLNLELNVSNKNLRTSLDETKKTLEKLESAENIMIQSSKLASLGVLGSGLAHEINNPLFLVSGFVKRIRKEFENKNNINWEDIQQYVEEIEDGSVRMTKIIKHMKEFSRQNNIEPRPCDMNLIAKSSFTLLNEQLKHREIKVEYNLSNTELWVNVDDIMIEQVFVNIIINSRDSIQEKALEGNGLIKVSLSSEKGNVIIIFEDNGIGIKEENLQKVFDPFFTTKEVGKGTGLGMSISYGIIKDHRGEIYCEAKEGGGARFTVSLPEIAWPKE